MNVLTHLSLSVLCQDLVLPLFSCMFHLRRLTFYLDLQAKNQMSNQVDYAVLGKKLKNLN
jgi:hypothetical protein